MDERSSKTIAVKQRLGLIAGAIVAGTLMLGAYGCSDSGEDSSSGEGGDAIVTGSAKCDRSSMQEAAVVWNKSFGDGGKVTLPDTPDAYRCADGWAVAFPEVGPESTAVTVTAVFEAEGQFWIPKDRAEVCGDSAATSEVPASLFRDACQTN